jgi:hypothetical protein
MAVRPRLARDPDMHSNSDIEAIIAAAGGLPADKVDHSDPSILEPMRVALREALAERLDVAVRDYLVHRHLKTCGRSSGWSLGSWRWVAPTTCQASARMDNVLRQHN